MLVEFPPPLTRRRRVTTLPTSNLFDGEPPETPPPPSAPKTAFSTGVTASTSPAASATSKTTIARTPGIFASELDNRGCATSIVRGVPGADGYEPVRRRCKMRLQMSAAVCRDDVALSPSEVPSGSNKSTENAPEPFVQDFLSCGKSPQTMISSVFADYPQGPTLACSENGRPGPRRKPTWLLWSRDASP